MPRRSTIAAVLALACLCAPLGCADDEEPGARIDFAASVPAIEPIVIDSGMTQVADGIEMRTITTMRLTWEFEASGQARGGWVDPIAETGSVAAHGELEIELHARVTRPGYELDGVVDTALVDVELEVAHFDPFIVDEPITLGLNLPSELEIRFDPPAGVGLSYFVRASLFFLPTYEGTCLAVDTSEGAAQYTGRLQPVGDIRYLEGVDLVTPLSRDRLGEIGVELDFAELGLEVDLGTYSLDDGTQVEGVTPCG